MVLGPDADVVMSPGYVGIEVSAMPDCTIGRMVDLTVVAIAGLPCHADRFDGCPCDGFFDLYVSALVGNVNELYFSGVVDACSMLGLDLAMAGVEVRFLEGALGYATSCALYVNDDGVFISPVSAGFEMPAMHGYAIRNMVGLTVSTGVDADSAAAYCAEWIGSGCAHRGFGQTQPLSCGLHLHCQGPGGRSADPRRHLGNAERRRGSGGRSWLDHTKSGAAPEGSGWREASASPQARTVLAVAEALSSWCPFAAPEYVEELSLETGL